jgi:transposase
MPQRHRDAYPREFKRKLVELVLAGRSPEELADEFEPTAQSIRNWVKQSQLDSGDRKDGLTSDERVEMARLRKRVKQLEMERDILSKAAAWFARESTDLPKRASDS